MDRNTDRRRKPLLTAPLSIALTGAAALAVAMGIGRFAFTPILPMMLEDGSLSLGAGGMLASANYIGYFLGALATAFIRIRPERAIPWGLLTISLTTLGMAANASFAIWALLRCLAGIASAWVLICVSAWSLSALSRYDRPVLGGLVFAGVGMGIAVTGLACLVLAFLGGTAVQAWLEAGMLALALTAVIWRFFCKAADVGPEAAFSDGAADGSATLSRVVPSTPSVPAFKWDAVKVRLAAAYGLFGFAYIIPATFLPVMARNAMPDPSLSAWSWPLFGTVAACSALVTGKLARRIGHLRLWRACQIVLGTGIALPAVSPGLLPIMLSALCVGGTFMVITLSAMQAARLASPSRPGNLIGAMTASFAAGQILGPLAVPFLSGGSPDLKVILLVSAASAAISAALLKPDCPRLAQDPGQPRDQA